MALDVGSKRIGLATMRSDTKLPQPLKSIEHDDEVWQNLTEIIKQNDIKQLVVGLPRNLNGEATSQTTISEQFAEELHKRTSLPVTMQDEALTSVDAERILRQKGKPFGKGEVDALAASLILSDFANTGGEL